MIEKAAAKLIFWACTALLVVGLFVAWRFADMRADAAELRATAAEASKVLQQKSGKLALDLATRTSDRERATSRRVAQVLKEIRDAKPSGPIPAACRPVLRPLDVALERMHDDESRAAGRRSTPAVVPGPSAAAGPRRPD